jgi:hypothetical protein
MKGTLHKVEYTPLRRVASWLKESLHQDDGHPSSGKRALCLRVKDILRQASTCPRAGSASNLCVRVTQCQGAGHPVQECGLPSVRVQVTQFRVCVTHCPIVRARLTQSQV